MAGALDRDYGNSRAVLIGTWDYQHLPGPLPAVHNSLDRMTALLTGELCGWPSDRLTIIRNQRDPGKLPDQLAETFDGVEDVALFYYVGHGQSDSDNKLCLGLVDTRSEASRRATTSLEFEDVRRALQHCGARTKIVILDCCFAGLAIRTEGVLAATQSDVAVLAGGTGAFTMAASGFSTLAQFEEHGPHPQTFFTKALADIIEASGIPGQPPGLKLGPIFNQLRNELRNANRPEPTALNRDSAAEFVFARNVTETAVEEPIVVAPVQPGPVRPDLVFRPPREIVDATADMARPDVAQLLTEVATTRHSQEVAALIESLRSVGRAADVAVIIRAAASLPVPWILDLQSTLHTLGLKQDAAALVTDDSLPDLLAALWPASGKQPAEPLVDWFLGGAAVRSDATVATAVSVLLRARQFDHVERLVALAVRDRSSTTELASLLTTLWPALVPVSVTGMRGVDNVLRVVDALRHNGWPIDANRLLATVAYRLADEAADTLIKLATAERDAEFAYLLQAFLGLPESKFSQVIAELLRREPAEVATCLTAFRRVGSELAADSLVKSIVATYLPGKIALLMEKLPVAERKPLLRTMVNDMPRLTTGRLRLSGLLELLIMSERNEEAWLLLDTISESNDGQAKALAARTATNLKRTNDFVEAGQLNDRVRPRWRRDANLALPLTALILAVIFLLIRAFLEVLARNDIGFWPVLASVVSTVVLLVLVGFYGYAVLPTSTARMMAEWDDPPAANALLAFLLVCTVLTGLLRTDWLGVTVIALAALIASDATAFWYDITGRKVLWSSVFLVASAVTSLTAPSWAVFIPVVAVTAVPVLFARRYAYKPSVWYFWTVGVTAGALAQWLLPQSWPWLKTTATAIGNVLSWGL